MPTRPPSHHVQTGFTLVELLVVVSITVMLLMTISIFFMTFIVGSSKAAFEQKLKQDGEQALNRISSLLRNARNLTSACNTGLTEITITNPDNTTSTLTADSGRIAVTTAGVTTHLTSNFGTLEPANTIVFNCYVTSTGQQYVEIDFTLKRGSEAINSATTLIRQFKTGITLRNL